MWIFYNVVFAIGYTLLLPRFLIRMARRGGYRRGFAQRFGLYDAATRARLNASPRIWIHAVSVGEMFVALRLMRELRAGHPARSFVVTVTTSTGHRIAESRLDPRDVLLYFPVDFPGVVRRVLARVQPLALLLTESELWPNLIRAAHARDIPVVLVNGRISSSSYRGYRSVRFFVRPILRSMSRLLVQSEGDRDRLVSLGAPPGNVLKTGTAKYDMTASATPDSRAREWLAGMGVGADDPIIVGGSTWPGEETALLDALRAMRRIAPTVRLVIVPRHAERGQRIEQELMGTSWQWVRRATGARGGDGVPDVFLADTTGELMEFYACATIVFVGKSLLHHGGQNFIEPALLAKPIVTGLNLENFPVVADEFIAADALVQARNADELGEVLAALLSDAERCRELARRGRALVESRLGAVRLMAQEIEAVLGLRASAVARPTADRSAGPTRVAS